MSPLREQHKPSGPSGINRTPPPHGSAGDGPPIPDYLDETYRWAYLHPRALKVFEHHWVVNAILLGNMNRLTRAVLEKLAPPPGGRVLQTACVYGDFSRRLAAALHTRNAEYHLVDVAPIQLENAARKLADCPKTFLHHQDSAALQFPDAHFDQTVLFFLLHEQPEIVRRSTLTEAWRVTRPGGTITIVDYHLPARGNPLRYLMRPVLHHLEPFALDLWNHPLDHYLPRSTATARRSHDTYFGGLYQRLHLHR